LRRLFLEGCQRAGELPLWDAGRAFGQPGLGSPDNSAAYPPTQLAVFLVGGEYAALVEGIFHTLLSLVLSYLLFFRLFRSRSTALLVAVTYSLSGMTLGVHWNPHHYAATAWLPGVALGVLGRRWGMLLVSLAAMALSPDPILLAMSLVLVTAYLVYEAVRSRQWRLLVVPPLVALAVFALGAAQLVPMSEFLPLTLRDSAFSLEDALKLTVPADRLLNVAVPSGIEGDLKALEAKSWCTHVYTGFLAIILMAGALRSSFRRYWWLWVFIVACFLVGFGDRPPLFEFFHDHVPRFDRIRFPPKFLSLAALASAFFAARTWAKGERIGRGVWISAILLVIWHVVTATLRAQALPGLLLSLSGVAAAVLALRVRNSTKWTLVALMIVGFDLALHSDLPSLERGVVQSSILGGSLESVAVEGDRFVRMTDDYPAARINWSDRDLHRATLESLVLGSCRLAGVSWGLDCWSMTSRNVVQALRQGGPTREDFPIQLMVYKITDALPPTLELEKLASDGEFVLYRNKTAPALVEFPGDVEITRGVNSLR
jgi:hypothetical protein